MFKIHVFILLPHSTGSSVELMMQLIQRGFQRISSPSPMKLPIILNEVWIMTAWLELYVGIYICIYICICIYIYIYTYVYIELMWRSEMQCWKTKTAISALISYGKQTRYQTVLIHICIYTYLKMAQAVLSLSNQSGTVSIDGNRSKMGAEWTVDWIWIYNICEHFLNV